MPLESISSVKNMIATLSGKLLLKYDDRIVIDLAGVGYDVLLPVGLLPQLPEIGEDLFLFIHTNVREDAITLYGFLQSDEKELFLTLKTVSGIGPKVALAMLSGMRVSEICQAITQGNIKQLTTLQGIGKKTAERICVELREKVDHLLVDVSGLAQPPGTVTTDTQDAIGRDAISGLTNLGYSESIAQAAVNKVKENVGAEAYGALKIEALIREALRALI